jgi:cyclophilin family peptidyl-prolyl cis-trans isomerase
MADGKVVVFETNHGAYEVTFNSDTPVATGNMLEKVEAGFFNNLTFHRVVKGFVIQGGDPDGTGMGGGQMKMDPIGKNSNVKGTISMASGSRNKPITDQSDCQFFINTADNVRLDDYGFVAFGKVTKGYEVIDKIENVRCVRGNDGAMSSPVEKVVILKAWVRQD